MTGDTSTDTSIVSPAGSTLAPRPPRDTVLWPLLDELRSSAAAQLGLVQRPVCHFVIYAADHPLPADLCDCECDEVTIDGHDIRGQGVGWVRFVRATTMLSGSALLAEVTASPCSGYRLLVTVEIGVYRCAPTLDETGHPPDDPTIDHYSAGASQDVLALHRTFLCSDGLRDEDTSWQITDIAHRGPAGGCVATVVTAQVARANCCPLVLTLAWEPDPDDMLTVHVQVTGIGDYGAVLLWGDGTAPEVLPKPGRVSHTYPTPGRYLLTAVDRAWPTSVATEQITVKDHAPRAHPFLDSDDDWQILLWLDEPDDLTTYRVLWGDNSPVEELIGPSGGRVPPRTRVPHQYLRQGQFEIVVTDTSTRRTTLVPIAVGEFGMVFTLDTPTRPRVQALWLASGATYEMDHADGSPPRRGIVPPTGRISEVRRTDLPNGHYRFGIREVIDGLVRREAVRHYIQPTQWDWRLEVAITWRDPADPPGIQTVRVQAAGARTRCLVQWGDGTPDETVAPESIAVHRYAVPAPTEGYRLRITETVTRDNTEPRTFTRVLGEPRYVGVPVLAARTAGSVDLDIAGADNDFNDDWYQVSWGDSVVDPVGAVGRWWPANHIYRSSGTKTITVDAPCMAAPVTRTVTIVDYPAPVVRIAEVNRSPRERAADPNRMTVQVTVDNTESGGPVTVLLDDGSPPVHLDEQGTFRHTYAEPGTYYVIAVSDADLTARGRDVVTVPFGDEKTLVCAWTEDAADQTRMTTKLTLLARDPNKIVFADWGVGAEQQVPPAGVLSHPYRWADTYPVSARYEDDSEAVSELVTVPYTRRTEV